MPDMQGSAVPSTKMKTELGEQPTGYEGADDPNVANQPKALSLARFGRPAAPGDSAYQLSRQMHNAFLRLARFGAIIS